MTINRLGWVTGALALVSLLGSGAAQAQTLVGPTTEAEGILDLNVNGTLYNVTFLLTDAQDIYGSPPGLFRFDTKDESGEAMDAVNAFLNDELVTGVIGGSELYKVAFAHYLLFEVSNASAVAALAAAARSAAAASSA